MKIICSGTFAQTNPGHIDNLMAYLVGFQQLGHEVYLMEDVDEQRCLDADHQPVKFEDWHGRDHLESIARFYGIWPRCCLIYKNGQAAHGMSFDEAIKTAKQSDLLVVVGGRLRTQEIITNVGCRAYVDINPAKTQVYHAEYDVNYGFSQFDHFFTVGLSIGTPGCDIPTGGLTWKGIVPPVVLDSWPPNMDERCKHFTTVSTWAGRHTFSFKGKFSGEKSDQWQRFISLPKKTDQELEIALNIDTGYEEDIAAFHQNGWILVDPKLFRNAEDYRQYISSSRAEFSVANNRYVQFNTGWISDRSTRYLAAGKPVLKQSTGIEDHLPTGKGLLTFTSLEEALAGIERINGEYLDHCRAARAIAEEHVDSGKVLTKMLRQMGF
jgi:hypothetical protein